MSKQTYSHLEKMYHKISQGPHRLEMTRGQIELALLLLDSHEWEVPIPPELAHLKDEDWETLELALLVLQEEQQVAQLH
tara:strand:- start:264 stop:500 length:237 start_codon:yes stop_codon:yes gene_type:complete